MIPHAVKKGAVRTCVATASFTLGAVFIGNAPLPDFLRAAGMIALPCVLLAVLRREDRRLSRAADNVRSGSVRPALRHFLFRQRGKLDQALHR
jgi:hypothetical protein